MILLLSEIFPPRHGGSGRWFYELYRRLARESVVLYTHTNGDKSEAIVDSNFPQIIHRGGFSNSEWGIRSVSGLRFYAKSFLHVRKLLKDGITQIHCGRCLHEGVLGALLAKLYRKKLVVYVHGEDIETAKTSRELKLLAQWVINSADCLVTNSDNTKTILKSAWDTDRTQIFTNHPGVDIDLFIPAEADEKFRSSMGWDGRFVVTTVGRLQRRKGQDKMIESLPMLRASIPNVLYAIVGDGDDAEYLRALAVDLKVENHVHFIPNASDSQLVKIYQQCDLFILPNRTEGNDIEGFGMVLVEAQACGKPVIAGESGGTAEALSPGVSGERIDCTDCENIARTIIQIHANPDRYSPTACRAFAEKLSWERHQAKATALFEDL